MHSRNVRSVFAAVVVVVAVGIIAALYVVPRVRARQQPSAWFESKNLTLSPVVKGLKEPTYVTGAPDGSDCLFILERTSLGRLAYASGQLQPSPLLHLIQPGSLLNEESLPRVAVH